jgi:hypothetical protein
MSVLPCCVQTGTLFGAISLLLFPRQSGGQTPNQKRLVVKTLTACLIR